MSMRDAGGVCRRDVFRDIGRWNIKLSDKYISRSSNFV